MVSNKYKGTKFENELCEKLYAFGGFWARPMFPAPDGSQPFDVMIINQRGNVFAIECKDCENDVFDLKRIEHNQEVALTRLLFNYNMHNRVFFAFNTSEDIFFVPAQIILDYKINSMFGKKNKKQLNLQDIKKDGINFTQFLSENGGLK